MTSLALAGYLRVIRLTDDIPKLHALAHILEESESNDEATMPLLRMIGLKVMRIERSN